MADELLPIACPSRNIPRGEPVEINKRVWFVDHDGFRVVLQGLDTPLFRFEVANKEEARLVSVALRLSGLARQEEVAHAFGHSVASQRRWERRYEDQGAFGVRSLPISGRPTKVGGGQDSYWHPEDLAWT